MSGRREGRDGPRPALLGGYVVQDRFGNALLRATDAVLARTIRHSRPRGGSIRKLLLANGRHLGDVVISTSLLPVLKACSPDLEIGMLVGSWARPVIDGHPLIDQVHIVDHWKLNRADVPLTEKIAGYVRTRGRALREIRSVGYDAAVELYGFFPNTIPLLWRSGIPMLAGYGCAGFGPLLTHRLEWTDADRHISEYQLDLLATFGFSLDRSHGLRPMLPPRSPAIAASLRARLDVGRPYTVIHMGAGSTLKEWSLDKWRAVAAELSARGERLIFTGQGAREVENSAFVASSIPGAVDLTGSLRWEEFVEVLDSAALVLCVDSVAGHVAAAGGVPCVVLMTGMNNPHHWRPLGPRVRVLSRETSCSPCYRTEGCATMECLRGITIEQVLAAAASVGPGRLAESGPIERPIAS